MRCHFGTPCDLEAEEGSSFCSAHRKFFARMREDIAQEVKRKRPGSIRQGRPKQSTCCRVGCYNPRVPPEPFCDECKETAIYD